jgi:hypothetical protein
MNASARMMFLAICASFSLAGCGHFGGDPAGPRPNDAAAIERSAEKGPVKLFVSVSPREPRLSDLVELEVAVESPPGVEIKPPAFGQAVGDFLIRDYNEKPLQAGERNVRRFRYQLEPAHAGKHLIRSVSIEFLDKRPDSEGDGRPALLETEPIEVNVTSELGDATPSLADLETMLPPQALPRPPLPPWPAIAAAVVVVTVLAIWAWRRRKRRQAEPRARTAEEIAHAALAALLAENLPGRGAFKEFYLRLTGIVRQYIEGTTGIRAPEQTTEEFLCDVRSSDTFPAARSARLAEFLQAADLVKYAGQQPGEGQVDEAILRAREFVKPSQTLATGVAGHTA